MGDKLWKVFERYVGEVIFGGSKRNPGSGKNNKCDDGSPRSGDVINDYYEIECKVYQSIAVFRWWDKLSSEARLSGKIPVLVMREKGDTKDTLVVIHQDTFIKMKEFFEEGGGIG